MIARLFASHPYAMALVLPALVAPAPALRAQPDEDEVLGEAPERYAQVKVLEGEVRIRKGDVEEALERGVPVAEGDVVESRGRGVLQLADGSRIAFAGGTRFHVAALFADRKGATQVLLRLDQGRLRVNLGSDSEAQIRVDTPGGSAALSDQGGITLEVESDRTVRLRVHSGRAAFENEADRARVRAGERLTVYGARDRLDRVRSFNTYDYDAFDDWCERQMRGRRGASWERVPSPIRHYSDDLDDSGEWVYVDDTSSWCWRPLRVSAEWRPYWRGRWGCYAGGMTWVSEEPWGYVTHHYGRWGWSSRWGWYWIPGVYYSPAWVAWNSCDSWFGWAPLGYWNTPCTWGYGAWRGGHCWNVVDCRYVYGPRVHSHVHVDVNVFHRFSGSGQTTWHGSGRPGDLTPPWRRGRLVVTPGELRQPEQFRRVVADRSVMQSRVATYERESRQATGRTLVRRDPTELRAAPSRPVAGAQAGAREVRTVPFERPEQGRALRPLVREGRAGRADTPGRLQEGSAIERRPPTRDRSREEAPRMQDRGERQVPREERRIERPVPPREERRIEREAPREERRAEPRREEAPSRPVERESRPVERESRPVPQAPRVEPSRSMPQRDSRPAPSAPPSRGGGERPVRGR